jgi:hypothetical protein
MYHPDTNPDPQAQSRVREITEAFAVVGDPAKRAAYDSLRSLGNEAAGRFGPDRDSPPPMRNLGLAAIGLALVLSLAFALWPGSGPRQRPQERRPVAASPKPTIHVAAPVSMPTPPPAVVAQVEQSPPLPPPTLPQPLPPPVPAPAANPPTTHAPRVPPREMAEAVVPKPPAPTRTPPAPRREIAQVVPPKAPPSKPVGTERPRSGSSATSDRGEQVERIATGFLRQSLAHADRNKQQQLISASNRSATSRSQCRSNECVTQAYLRQIRDITAIMEGRSPTE